MSQEHCLLGERKDDEENASVEKNCCLGAIVLEWIGVS